MSTAMQTVEVASAKKLGGLQSLLEKYKVQIAMALPKHLTPERMIRVALTAVSRTPTLQECSDYSICGCVVQASILGLEPDGILGEAYLVPFYNKKTKQKECQLIPGYQGLLKLVRNSGDLVMVNAQVVHRNDRFEFEDGLDPFLIHKRGEGARGPITAYWAGAVLKGGGKQFVVMTRDEVEQHRDRYSKAKDFGPWVEEFDAMALKTCLRKLTKLLPKSAQAQIAVSLDERGEAGIGQAFSVDVPLELHPTESEPERDPIQTPRRASETQGDMARHIKNLHAARELVTDELFFRALGAHGFDSGTIDQIPADTADTIVRELLSEAAENRKLF